MQYVSSIPPPTNVPETGLEVQALAGVKHAKLVHARTSPPLVVQPHTRREAHPDITGEGEKRHDTNVCGERRIYCRRVEHLSILIELRSIIDRRRHNQRVSDTTEHVDVKV